MQVLTLTTDPTGSFPHAGESFLQEAAGIIPHFFATALERAHVREEAPTLDRIADYMTDVYGFGGFAYPMGGELTEDGVYQYAGEPELAPIATISGEGLRLYIYEYGITALTDGERTVTGRFD